MSQSLLASKIVIVEEEPRIRSLQGVPTAVVGAVGITERGPVGEATRVSSFEEYTRTFGGFTPNSDLALAVLGFFQNGGRRMWVVRTVHYTDITDPATRTSVPGTLTLQDRAALPVDTLRIDAKWDGAYSSQIRILVNPPTSGAESEFNLAVEQDGVIAETFANLSLDSAAASYAPGVINSESTGSSLVAATDLESASASPDHLPAEGIFGPLAGGNDGLAALSDTDFLGSAVSATGLRALDAVQELSLLIVPGRATAAVHNAMVSYCEDTRDKACFAVLDPPEQTDAPGIVTYVQDTAGLLGLTEFAAIYWPRVQILNPDKNALGSAERIVAPPSGHVAGVYARLDASSPGGVYKPPAGIENGRLVGVLGFETAEVLDEARRDLVFPKRINPLTTFPGTSRHIDGARTLKGGGNFPTVAERRGVIFIEQTLKTGLLFAKHRNHTERLRAEVRRAISTFLLIQMRNGAFRSQEPDKAFFVDVSEALNPPSVVFAGQLIARIGLATNKPAEFVIVRISQDTREIDMSAGTG